MDFNGNTMWCINNTGNQYWFKLGDEVRTMKKTITIRDIIEEENLTVEEILDAPIFGINMAGDEWGFELLGACSTGIHLMAGDYFKPAI